MPVSRFGMQVERSNLHKTVYIDQDLLDWQKTSVIAAINEWEAATNNEVVFTVKISTQTEEASITDDRHSLIIRNTSIYDPEITMLDSGMPDNKKTTGGYVKHGNSIPTILLVNARLENGIYRISVLHELGHALGLLHNNDKNSIMYPWIDDGAGRITNIDIEQFNELYSMQTA